MTIRYLGFWLLLFTLVHPSRGLPDAFSEAKWEPQPGARVPVELPVWDATGEIHVLGDLLGAKPVVLVPANPQCKHMCSTILTNAARALHSLAAPGDERFAVLGFDIVPAEQPLASAPHGWPYAFFAATATTLQRLTGAIGFRYAYDSRQEEWAHPAGLVVLTPDGRVSRYLFGVDFSPLDLRLAVADAAGGKVATVTERLLLRCFRYDGHTGKYTPAIAAMLRIAGLLTCLGMGVWIWRMNRNPGGTG